MTTAISELAWHSWCAGGNPVACGEERLLELGSALAEGVLFEQDKGLCFADKLVLVKEAAAFVLGTEDAHLSSSGENCYRRLRELWQQDKVDEASLVGAVLAGLHNAQRIDGYAFAKHAVIAGMNFYDVTRPLEEAIELLAHASASSILSFFGGDYGERGHAPTATLLEPMEKWLSRHIEVAREIKQLHEAAPKESQWGVYVCALHAIVEWDFPGTWPEIVRAAESAERTISGPALHVMGIMDYKNPEKPAASADTLRICTHIVRTPGHLLLGQAASVLGRMIGTHKDQVVPLLDEAGRSADIAALSAVTHILLREARDRSREPWFWSLALHLTRVPPDQKDILSMVDLMLSAWLKDEERAPRTVEFLNLWMAQQSGNALRTIGPEVVFDSVLVELVRKPAIFSRLITAWLLEEDRRYPHAVRQMISKLTAARVHHFVLAPELLDPLGEEELRFLVRRILGYLVSEDPLLSLVFSMVRTRDAKSRTFGFVSTVLRDHVGRDYPQPTLDFLKGVQSSGKEGEDVTNLCAAVARDIEAILGQVAALPDLREFHPPEGKAIRLQNERQRQLNDAIEGASKNSIWRQIATQIPLKGGIRTFHSQQGQYSAPMELKPMSHSVAIPLSSICDPVGGERERLQFRSSPKPSA